MYIDFLNPLENSFIYLLFFLKKKGCLNFTYHFIGGEGGGPGTFNLPFVVSVRMLLFPKKIYTQKKKKRFLPDEGMGEGGGGVFRYGLRGRNRMLVRDGYINFIYSE